MNVPVPLFACAQNELGGRSLPYLLVFVPFFFFVLRDPGVVPASCPCPARLVGSDFGDMCFPREIWGGGLVYFPATGVLKGVFGGYVG